MFRAYRIVTTDNKEYAKVKEDYMKRLTIPEIMMGLVLVMVLTWLAFQVVMLVTGGG